MTVTRKVKTITGIRAAVVNDRMFLNGRLAERTTDWYAQDKHGTVWYLGEQTAELNAQGKVTSTEGSFLNGRDGGEGRHLHARAPGGRSVLPAGGVQGPRRGSRSHPRPGGEQLASFQAG